MSLSRAPSQNRFRLTRIASVLAIAALFFAQAGLAQTTQPVDVVFVLDNSGSMKTNDPEFLTRRAVADFVDALAADDTLDGRVAIVLFDGRVRLGQALMPASDLASTRRLDATLAALDYSGARTDSPAGIERALYELRQRGRDEARKAIVFLTDGRIDTGNAQNDVEVARWLREDLAGESADGDVRIFGIAFTEAADYQLMQALALRTDASYYRAFAPGELGPVVDDVLTKLAATPVYDLAYSEPPTPAPAPLPDVAAAPLPTEEDDTPSGLVAWFPALLLLAGAGLWAARRTTETKPVRPPRKLPAAQLLDLGGQVGASGRALPLKTGRTTIGRDPNNDVVLDDDTVSSEHAAIEVRDGRYWLEDLRSTNGTRLSDRRLREGERFPLKGGDHVRLADVDLMFVVEGYVPGGATVYLSSSTTPPADWSTLVEGDDAAAEATPAPIEAAIFGEPPAADAPRVEAVLEAEAPGGEIVFAEQRERLDPAEVVDLDARLAAPDAETVDPPAPPSTTAVERARAALEAVERGESDPVPHTEHENADPADPLDAASDATRPKGRPNLELVTSPPDEDVSEPVPAPDEEATELFPDAPPPSAHDARSATGHAQPAASEVQPAASGAQASVRSEASPDADVPNEAPADPPEAVDDRTAAPAEPSLSPVSERSLPPVGEPGGPNPPLAACLDHHLRRVAEISPAFGDFVARAFPEDLRQALPVSALEVVDAARASGRAELRPYTRDRIRYVVCGLPGAMVEARDRFVADFGGFTRVLNEQLQHESFSRDRCEILALLTCG
ncbi:MAG: FHA domain-containing protein, partial [Myxococcota bacterium]